MATRTMNQGTPIVWRGTGGDYGISLESLATTKAAQGAKGNLAVNSQFSRNWAVQARLESGSSAPAAGSVLAYIYWSSSDSATAATRNDGGASGVDEAYKDGEESEWVKQLTLIGVLVATNDASTVQQDTFKFKPPTQYGMPVVLNASGQTFESNHDEHMISFIPLLDVVV